MVETTPHYDESTRLHPAGRGLRLEPDRPLSEARRFTEAEKRWRTILHAVDSGLSLPEYAKQDLGHEQFGEPSAEQAPAYIRILDASSAALEGYPGVIKAYAAEKAARRETHPEKASELLNAKMELSRTLKDPEVTRKAVEFARLFMEEEMRKHDVLFADDETGYEALQSFKRMEAFVDTLQRIDLPLDETVSQLWQELQAKYNESVELKATFIHNRQVIEQELLILGKDQQRGWQKDMAQSLIGLTLSTMRRQLRRGAEQQIALPDDAQEQYDSLAERFNQFASSAPEKEELELAA